MPSSDLRRVSFALGLFGGVIALALLCQPSCTPINGCVRNSDCQDGFVCGSGGACVPAPVASDDGGGDVLDGEVGDGATADSSDSGEVGDALDGEVAADAPDGEAAADAHTDAGTADGDAADASTADATDDGPEAAFDSAGSTDASGDDTSTDDTSGDDGATPD